MRKSVPHPGSLIPTLILEPAGISQSMLARQLGFNQPQPVNELVKGKVEMHHGDYVKVEAGSTRTSVPGLFAAGDLTDHVYRQAVTSAGMGCMAALDAEKFLAEQE